MPKQESNCDRIFGFPDFDPTRVDARPLRTCPIRDCSTELTAATYSRKPDKNGNPRTKLWCLEHGIRLHSGTFVYWNGRGPQDDSRLRNFIVRQDLVKAIALGSGAKAESHRLGYEMSEDALSWNVFVGLAEAGKLKDVAYFLTKRNLTAEPDLYLWGKRIDVHGQERGRFAPLWDVRKRLERGIHSFNTEPDIMLVVEGEMVICIEAKFGSGNSLAHDANVKDGEKPTARAALVERYLGESTKASTRAAIRCENIGPKLHSQLFRNLVFASEMAVNEWHVVNLVSRTQHLLGRESARGSFADPTDDVLSYLSPESRSRFTYRTWEDLYSQLIKDTSQLMDLVHYMQTKSAHFRRAFELA
jgi:hypothetical protein